MSHLFALGFGFSAHLIAQQLLTQRWRVTGTKRQPKPDATHPNGLKLITLDQAFTENEITDVTHVLVSIPPSADGDPVLPHWAPALYQLPHLKWIGYLSTVGVYGDHGGAWVDETTPPAPVNKRSQWRIQAEHQWQSFAAARGVACQVFRLSGIYGPQRNALERVENGTAQRIIKPGQVFNRIHVADIAQTVLAGMTMPNAGPIFNVSDDLPAPPQDVISYAATLLGAPSLPDIPFERAELSPMAKSFYSDNKRIRNDKLKSELGIKLKYPTYRDGLAAEMSAFSRI